MKVVMKIVGLKKKKKGTGIFRGVPVPFLG